MTHSDTFASRKVPPWALREKQKADARRLKHFEKMFGFGQRPTSGKAENGVTLPLLAGTFWARRALLARLELVPIAKM